MQNCVDGFCADPSRATDFGRGLLPFVLAVAIVASIHALRPGYGIDWAGAGSKLAHCDAAAVQ